MYILLIKSLAVIFNIIEFILGFVYLNKSINCNSIIKYQIWIITKSTIAILFWIPIFEHKILKYINYLIWIFWFIWLIFGMVIFWGDCSNNIPIVVEVFTYISLFVNILYFCSVKFRN